MNKHYLMSQMKSSGTAYVLWFFLGAHYAYLGKWGWQILYWFTLGGFGLWHLVSLFIIPDMVRDYNMKISRQLDELEKKEREETIQMTASFQNAQQNTPLQNNLKTSYESYRLENGLDKVISFEVAGTHVDEYVTHYWNGVKEFMQVELEPEPMNPYDENAIAVKWENNVIGYVPKTRISAVKKVFDNGFSTGHMVKIKFWYPDDENKNPKIYATCSVAYK